MSTKSNLQSRSWVSFSRSALVCLAAAGLLALSAAVTADHPGKGGRPFDTLLTGDAEVPGPGHPEARGTVELRLNPGQQEVCFMIRFEGIDPDDPDDLITAGHIHVGSEDVAGPVVVNFALGADGPIPVDDEGRGSVSGCVSASRDLIRAIIRNPDGYYVNLHSPNFPPGAIRGQLSK